MKIKVSYCFQCTEKLSVDQTVEMNEEVVRNVICENCQKNLEVWK